jgi:hypothetical protein
MFLRVRLAARDRFADLGALGPELDAAAWEAALGDYWEEHEAIDDGPAGRAPELLMIERSGRTWNVRQIIADPEGHYDWSIVATVDLDASDAAGEPVIQTRSFGSAGH